MQLGFTALTNALPQVKAGKIRALAVTTRGRHPDMPQVPTVAESGYPASEATAWLGLVAPKGTPAAVIARLDAEVQRILGQPETQKLLVGAGQDVDLAGPAEFGSYIREESVKWLRLARSVNLSE